jgi:excisionase family DNA binding protein
LLPNSGPDPAHGGAGEVPPASGPSGAKKTPLRASTAPTLADLGVLYGGRGRLLRVAEVAEHLGVCAATVYRLCESGELPHVRIINSIRVRPADLAVFINAKPGLGGPQRGW